MDENGNIVSRAPLSRIGSWKRLIGELPPHKAVQIIHAFNEFLFNGSLNGIYVDIFHDPKDITMICGLKETSGRSIAVICLNESLVKRLTPKYFIQLILYQMIFVHVSLIQHKNKNSDDDIIQAYMQRAINYVNKEFGSNLYINFDFHAPNSRPSNEAWTALDEDELHVSHADTTIIEINDDDDDAEFDAESILKSFGITKLFTKRIVIQTLNDSDEPRTCVCCPNYKKGFDGAFKGTNFVSVDEADDKQCPLCRKLIKRKSFIDHLCEQHVED